LVLQTSYESELLQVAHAVMDSSRITQINVFMVRVPGPMAERGRPDADRAGAIVNLASRPVQEPADPRRSARRFYDTFS
jgi:hypothetical protein